MKTTTVKTIILIYLMLFILDIKTVMYDEFFYDYMKPEYYNK